MRWLNWTHSVTRLSVGALLALLIGRWSDQLILVPLIFLLSYLAWQFYNSIRLQQGN